VRNLFEPSLAHWGNEEKGERIRVDGSAPKDAQPPGTCLSRRSRAQRAFVTATLTLLTIND
jgi:hypothetical protein